MKKELFFALLLISVSGIHAQQVTQAIKGRIIDEASHIPLVGASVLIPGTDPVMGTISDIEGYYRIDNVPVGRYNIEISYLGYEPFVINEVLISSGKEVVLNIPLKESVTQLEGVKISGTTSKDEPLNTMAMVSARQLSVEEANRYAGGFDDPARLASSYAGVASEIGNNGIVIRGNAPTGLLWRMEGVEISNPTHFAEIIAFGGGGVTALSSQMLANSDFLTGAFPAEYGNALSGVFDINMRTGNFDKREYTFGISVQGIDFSAEGPFIKGKRSSYLINYRYSTYALLTPLLPPEAGILRYQDLAFKLNFPTKNLGTFTLWSIMADDYQGKDADSDSSLWEEEDHWMKEYTSKIRFGAVGVTHKKIVGKNTYVRHSMAASGNFILWDQHEYDTTVTLYETDHIKNDTWKYTLAGFINHKFNASHTNRTGYIIDRRFYNVNIRGADNPGETVEQTALEKGNASLLQLYTQSKIDWGKKVSINAGIHSQYFQFNGEYTIEPRIGIGVKINKKHMLSLGYGLHSRTEMIGFYLVRISTPYGIIEPNKNLRLTKAHHVVLGYDVRTGEHSRLKIEPYYQKLFDLPVIPGSYFALVNLEQDWYFNEILVNDGEGRNIGIDITYERFLHHGFYYLFTGSVFDSKYRGGDGLLRNSKYDKTYLFNVLGGREWNVGKGRNNILGVNAKFSYIGGDRIHPVLDDESEQAREVVEDLTRAYADSEKDAPILSLSFSFRKNKPTHSSIWNIQVINVFAHGEFRGYEWDEDAGKVKPEEDVLFIPNIGYKIEF